MPDFGNPFAGMATDRKVTHEELIRAIRFSIAAEYEAVQLYIQLAESTDNRLAQEVLRDIADEELVHVGEFLRVLKELAPNEAALYAEGEAEVDEIIASLAQGKSAEKSSGDVVEAGGAEAESIAGSAEQSAEAKPETQPEREGPQTPKGIGSLIERP